MSEAAEPAQRVLLLGAGLVAQPLIDDLLAPAQDGEPDLPGLRLTVADLDPERAEDLLSGDARGRAIPLDVEDAGALDAAVGDADLVVSLLPAPLHPGIARRCVERGIPLVTCSYVSDEMRALDAEARERGVLLLNECGLDPGIDHALAADVIRSLEAEGAEILAFASYCGGLPAPESNDNPWGYKFSWSPRGVLLAARSPARYLADGVEVEQETAYRPEGLRALVVPDFGTLEAYPCRDSLAYREKYGLVGIRDLYRGTLRYSGWSDSFRALLKLGLLDLEPVELPESTWEALLDRLLPPLEGEEDSGTDPAVLRARLLLFLDGDGDHPLVERLEWLGVLDGKPLPEVSDDTASPLDLLAAELEGHLGYGAEDRDAVLLEHHFLALAPDGKRRRIVKRLVATGQAGDRSAMALTVGTPAAIAVRRILAGEVGLTGVRIPVAPEFADPILSGLDRRGFVLGESREDLDGLEGESPLDETAGSLAETAVTERPADVAADEEPATQEMLPDEVPAEPLDLTGEAPADLSEESQDPGMALEGAFLAFIAERFPFALTVAQDAFRAAFERAPLPPAEVTERPRDADYEALQNPLSTELLQRLAVPLPAEVPETTPRVPAAARLDQASAALIEECRGFLRRQAIQASLTRDEARELLRGMILTRATDNRLKAFYASGEVRFRGAPFQGKGFRSLGQEAIYGAALRLRRSNIFRDADGTWHGDFVAPLIRDSGVALAMRPEPQTIRMILNAQMGKAGPPMEGKDLHLGDFGHGIVPAAAPLSISSLTVAGIGMALAMEHQDNPGAGSRVALSFIGEGGSSLGEWHEAVNLCAARKLPVIFCVQNNQTALSTPVPDQSAVRVFADKAAGYGIPGLTVDGTDPEAVAAAFAWAAERARAGFGPTLLELVALRLCGHAHHDDMLYLGKEPKTDGAAGWEIPDLTEGGYADPEAWAYWSRRDPIATYAERLRRRGWLEEGELSSWREEVTAAVEEEARAVIEAPWPEPSAAGEGVTSDGPPAVRREVLEERPPFELPGDADLELDLGSPVSADGATFLEAITLGVRDALEADPRVFVYGEDVGGKYGNAFLLLQPLLEQHGDRILNSPLAESGVLGVCVGAALAGRRPIGEMQFNDFVATGFNQLVNNAAKIRYRWGASVPMVVRMPWGGLRKAGPYHSQNTEGWFYRTPGLKIVAPSTPEDARALLAAAVTDPDPVLFYEHIALYRDPRIKQVLSEEAPEPLPLGRAALRRKGNDLAILTYGAYVHRALEVAGQRLANIGIEASVLDLRSLVPLDLDACLALTRACGRVLIVHEDTRRGSLGESLAATLQELAFEYLDAPIRVLASLDTPVPYSPPLEEAFLPSLDEIEYAARLLVAY